MSPFNPALQRTLAEAVDAGDSAAAQRALDAGANVDWAVQAGGAPPLVIAARRGDAAMVEWLLARGAFAGAIEGDAEPKFAMEFAAERGDTEIVRRILARFEYLDAYACGAVVAALARGPHDDTDMLAVLLAACSEGPALPRPLLDAAAEAAAESGHAGLVGELLDRGARPASVHSAARAGQAEILRRLAAVGASINRADNETGETPLHAAVRAPRNAMATVEALLRLACRENARLRDGATPAALARSLGRPELAQRIETLAPQCGPRWMREARERGIERYVFYLTKAHGLGFDPHDIEQPVLWEGDYMGFGYAFSAADALAEWRARIEPISEVREATRWFVPFMEKLAAGEDFGLQELERAAGKFRVEKAG